MLLFVNLIFFIVVFLLTFYAVNSHNELRKIVSDNPSMTTGKVISISGGKGVHAATYEFIIDSRIYSGTTFTSYKGTIGDNLCLVYKTDNPQVSIYCDENVMEDWFDDSFLLALKILGIMVGFSALFICWQLLRQDKKFLSELTSAQGKYR